MTTNALLEWVLFLALGGIAVAAAAFMILTMSMYRAGLTLMVSFVAIAGLFFLLDAELLAIIQIMTNVGGMLVMILFMVMLMTDPGGQMMWDMKREMHMAGLGALSMSMPRGRHEEMSAAQHGTPDTTHADRAMPGMADEIPADGFTCPMHAEVHAATPGACPKCGMALVPAHSEADHGDAAGMDLPGMNMAGTSHESHHQMMVHMAMTTEQLPWALVLGAVTALALSALVLLTPWPVAPRQPVADATQAVGSLLMSRYMMAFEGAAMLILAGIAGAVILGRREPGAHHPARPSGVPSDLIYTCPMHPEVQRHGPGTCPKCGMALAPAAELPASHGDEHGAHDRAGAEP